MCPLEILGKVNTMRHAQAALAALTLSVASVLTAPSFAFDLQDMQFYGRGEVGASWLAQDRGHWCGPGCAVPPPGSDPRITHDLDADPGFFGSLALGAVLMPGLRGDLSVSHTASRDVHGDWILPQDGSTHADMDADVSAWTFMANAYLEPLAMAGNTYPIQPFITGGIGVSFNRMSDWTRTNPTVMPVRRTFQGETNAEFAWTVGGGVSASLGQFFDGRDVTLDLTYRYMDLGNVKGSATPVGTGAGPDEPFNFEMTNHVVSLGVRIPFSAN